MGPKPGTSANSCVQQPARFKNDVWTCDFIHDRTASGRPLKWLTLVDEYTRECLVLHADSSITGADVRRIVARVIGRRGAPTRIRSDNGSEFICEALVNWLPGMGAKSIPVAAGSPWENGYIESFHSRLRDEFLERVEFEDVADARAKAFWYRREYNAVRPHSSLGYATPKEFSAACDQKGINRHIPTDAHILVFNFFLEDSHFRWTKKRGAAQCAQHHAGPLPSSETTRRIHLVPTLSVGMPSWTHPRPAMHEHAERGGRHSHGDRGNEYRILRGGFRRGVADISCS